MFQGRVLAAAGVLCVLFLMVGFGGADGDDDADDPVERRWGRGDVGVFSY